MGRDRKRSLNDTQVTLNGQWTIWSLQFANVQCFWTVQVNQSTQVSIHADTGRYTHKAYTHGRPGIQTPSTENGYELCTRQLQTEVKYPHGFGLLEAVGLFPHFFFLMRLMREYSWPPSKDSAVRFIDEAPRSTSKKKYKYLYISKCKCLHTVLTTYHSLKQPRLRRLSFVRSELTLAVLSRPVTMRVSYIVTHKHTNTPTDRRVIHNEEKVTRFIAVDPLCFFFYRNNRLYCSFY